MPRIPIVASNDVFIENKHEIVSGQWKFITTRCSFQKKIDDKSGNNFENLDIKLIHHEISFSKSFTGET